MTLCMKSATSAPLVKDVADVNALFNSTQYINLVRDYKTVKTYNLNSGTPGNSKNAFLHCGALEHASTQSHPVIYMDQ